MIVATLLVLLPLASSEIIANLFEWSHDDVANECNRFIHLYDYDAVQVSPVNEHAILNAGPWWERYQVFSYRLISRSGDEEAFRKMVQICNGVGVKVYVDVAFNHMSGDTPQGTKGTGGSIPDPQNRLYPDVPYGPNDFHPACAIQNWTNPVEIRNCELSGLHDLNQTTEYVRGKIVGFLNNLVDIGVAGFRVDAAKHMNPSDLQVIYQRVNNLNTTWFPEGSRPNIYQEVPSGPSDTIQPEEYTGMGRALDFRYGFELSKAFTGGNQLKWLSDFGESWHLLPWKDSVVFIDNHDTQRNGVFGITPLSYKQDKLYKMANGFMLAWPHEGALVMSSYSFDNYDQGPPSYPVPINENLTCSGGWVCEHRWRQIYNMVTFAKVVQGTEVKNWWSNENNQIAFCRGNKGFVAFNADKNSLDDDIQTGLAKGIYCDVVSGKVTEKTCTGKVLSVRGDGYARVSIPHDSEDGFIAIHVDSRIL